MTSTDNPAGRLHQFLAAIRARGNSQNTIATGVIAVWDLNPAVMPVLYDRIAMVSRQPDEVEAQVLALAERKPTLEVNIDGLLEHKNDWERASASDRVPWSGVGGSRVASRSYCC